MGGGKNEVGVEGLAVGCDWGLIFIRKLLKG